MLWCKNQEVEGSDTNSYKSDKSHTRYGWADWAKAIGILLVVMGHTSFSCEEIVPFIFMIHMPLFFVVSGFLFSTEKSIGGITESNLKRLFIPYIIYNIIFLLYQSSKWILFQSINKTYNVEAGILNPLYHFMLGIADGNFDGPTWFLLALIWCKYFTYLCCKGDWITKLIVITAWLALFIARITLNISYPFALDCACAGVLWFEAGYIMRLYKDTIHLPYFCLWLAVPIGFVICYAIMTENGHCNYILARTGGILGIIGTGTGLISFFSLCKLLDKFNNKIVILISKASIITMCLHMMVNEQLELRFHYMGHLYSTIIVDIAIVLFLSSLYPIISKYLPVLVGDRK